MSKRVSNKKGQSRKTPRRSFRKEGKWHKRNRLLREHQLLKGETREGSKPIQ